MRQRGFTVFELIITTTVVALVMVVVTQSMDIASRFRERVALQNDLNNRANDVLNRLSIELRNARGSDMILNSPTNTYSYYVCNGIDKVTFGPSYDTANLRQIIYDPAKKELRRIRPGYAAPGELLASDLDADGFSLTRAGSTLRMALKMRTSTSRKTGVGNSTTGEDIIYAAQSRVLFLRSTLAASTGAAAVTMVADPDDEDGSLAATGTCLPSIFYGNLVTQANTQEQITVVITPLVGQKLRTVNPSGIWVSKNDSPQYWYSTTTNYNDGAIVDGYTGDGTVDFNLTRVTTVSPSGSITVTLTGQILSSVKVWVNAWTSDGNFTVEIWDY